MERCLWCGSPATVVYVHGHGQCSRCGVNVDPCCGGAATDGGASTCAGDAGSRADGRVSRDRPRPSTAHETPRRGDG